MRVLVEQTMAEIREWVAKAGLLWGGDPGRHGGLVGVHELMGGSDVGDWHIYPEENAVLVGTQDMLLSRALNRGYAAPRARWPMEFGLLNQDTLWIADEVQLMDVGLATTAQLQWFREEDQALGFRPAFTWWMSATLQPSWLQSVDTQPMIDQIMPAAVSIAPEQRVGSLWQDVSKPLRMERCADAAKMAEITLSAHDALQGGKFGRITLVVVNRVPQAVAVFDEIRRRRPDQRTELAHSRFRGAERKQWRDRFLSRNHCAAGTDLILVATQVVEAGVDISAGCLVTELAPWPSLVQRFGRAARYGGNADIIVLDTDPKDDKAAAPYKQNELDAARKALAELDEVSLRALEEFEQQLSDNFRHSLYPYEPPHLLLRQEIEELFDTTPDLTGADLDISRFIRTGEENDCRIFWAEWSGDSPPADLQPTRDAICSVPVYEVHKWLLQQKGDFHNSVYLWDYLEGDWVPPRRKSDIYPGRVFLVRSSVGGYNVERGFTGSKLKKNELPIPVIPLAESNPDNKTDEGERSDALSESTAYQSIAQHGAEVAAECAALTAALGVDGAERKVLTAAARYHDIGKAHPAFRQQIQPPEESGWAEVPDIAKAPQSAWRRGAAPPMRHELAGALALMELLALADQQHSALLGSCQDYIDAGVLVAQTATGEALPESIAAEVRELSASEFDLLIYLVCAHHGKVRAALHASPTDQEAVCEHEEQMPVRGIREGDTIPGVRVQDAHGNEEWLRNIELHLAPAQLGLSGRYGASWRDRTLRLQKHYGPFALAWMEAMLRAADVRVSRREAHS